MYKTRRYAPGDDSGIVELLRTCFPRTFRGSSYWNWVHKNNPLGFHGEDGDIWIAEGSNGSIVGYYGTVRTPLWYFGRENVFAGQVTQLATHPDYQRQGIYKTLADQASLDAKENGFELLLGYPNANSFRASYSRRKRELFTRVLANDYHLILDVQSFVRTKHSRALARAARSLQIELRSSPKRTEKSSEASKDHELTEGFKEDVYDVWTSVRGSYDIGTNRTKSYLEWRYHQNWESYKIVSAMKNGDTQGFVVYRLASKEGVATIKVADLVSKNDGIDAYAVLLDEIARMARTEEVAYVSIAAPQSASVKVALESAGFMKMDLVLGDLIGSSRSYVLLNPLGGKDDLQHARLYHASGDKDVG